MQHNAMYVCIASKIIHLSTYPATQLSVCLSVGLSSYFPSACGLRLDTRREFALQRFLHHPYLQKQDKARGAGFLKEQTHKKS